MTEPAFPTGTGVTPYKSGMSLRDYFAAKAMQAFIVKGIIPAEGLNKKQAVVSMAYETADEMMKQRSEK
jgi:hypothetical protein